MRRRTCTAFLASGFRMLGLLRLTVLLLVVGAFGCGDDGPSAGPGEAAPVTSAEPAAGQDEARRAAFEEAARITQAYGTTLQATPTDGSWVYGTSRLPAPKLEVRAALFRMLGSVTTPREIEFLKAALMRLAFFQEGVQGTADLAALAPDGRRYREIVETEVSELALEVARRGYGAPPG